jgi:hypothetical protein
MLRHTSVLGSLVRLIDRLPWPPEPPKRLRGHPKTYSDRLIVKALVIMIIRRLSTAYALVAFLDQEAPLPQQLRPLLCEQGRFPSRRTWKRRLAVLPQRLPGLLGCIGRHVVILLQPWARHGRAVACASTPLAPGGGGWHKKQQEQGIIPHSSIETEAGWSKSGWHGWWYGWKLHLAVTVGALWRPLAAELPVAKRGDTEEAPLLLEQLPAEVRYGRGDTHYNTPELRQECHLRGWELVATRHGSYPHGDGGVEVRQIFHKLRSQGIETFNGLFKNVFEWRVKMPVKGLQRSPLLALGAVVIYQVVLLYQHERHLPLGKGIKALLRAA